MKNATVTIDYGSFQAIKDKADRHDGLVRKLEQILEEKNEFTELICKCIENANEQKMLENKQFFIAKGILAICEEFGMDVEVEFGKLEEGVAPDV